MVALANRRVEPDAFQQLAPQEWAAPPEVGNTLDRRRVAARRITPEQAKRGNIART
jgi:hypothetical protein